MRPRSEISELSSLRRASSIETGLFQIQAEIMREPRRAKPVVKPGKRRGIGVPSAAHVSAMNGAGVANAATVTKRITLT